MMMKLETHSPLCANVDKLTELLKLSVETRVVAQPPHCMKCQTPCTHCKTGVLFSGKFQLFFIFLFSNYLNQKNFSPEQRNSIRYNLNSKEVFFSIHKDKINSGFNCSGMFCLLIVICFCLGGIDSTVIALLAHQFVPHSEPIDLLNVAFEKNHNFNVPDRLTGLSSLRELQELCPDRQWNFVEVTRKYFCTLKLVLFDQGNSFTFFNYQMTKYFVMKKLPKSILTFEKKKSNEYLKILKIKD